MSTTAFKVAVLGSGISGAVCASTLARNGVSVTLFESARGPGGRMSQRREKTEDGKELQFDHGAPFFSVSKPEVLRLVQEWESRSLVADWKENFGSFDFHTLKFDNIEQEGLSKRFVGVPGMNSICKALCNESGVESKFGTGVGRVEWLDDEKLWSLTGVDGQNLGQFKGLVASDKSIVSTRTTEVTGRLPPLDLKLLPELSEKLHDFPVKPRFIVMLGFEEPLTTVCVLARMASSHTAGVPSLLTTPSLTTAPLLELSGRKCIASFREGTSSFRDEEKEVLPCVMMSA